MKNLMKKTLLGASVLFACCANAVLAADTNPAVVAPQPVVLQPAAPMTAVAPTITPAKESSSKPAAKAGKSPAKKGSAKSKAK
jgi:hypothetical protein